MEIQQLIGNTEVFPILRNWDFYNHAGVCPLPSMVAAAMRQFADQCEATAYLGWNWYKDIAALREASAKLIGASADEIAFIKNTSEGIATVANGIDFQSGDRIVTTGVEYPANMYPWMDIARRKNLELVLIAEETASDGSRQVPIEKILEQVAHPRTRLLALSHVEFASGQKHDLARLGEFCRQNGKLLSVDGIQSVGAAEIDVVKMNIDFLSADGHKWMLSTEGAGIFYCRRELLKQTHPLIIGWMNVNNPERFSEYNFSLKENAQRFESGSFTVCALMGLKAAVEMLLSAGTANIAARLRQITSRLIDGLLKKGYQISSPRTGGQDSGIVSFTSPRHDHQAIAQTLRSEHKTEIAVRTGRLRVSPHFYNTEEQIDRLLEHLPGH